MKVLIVDDLQDIREFVKRILNKKEIQCDTAENGAKALALAETNSYDLILLDIRLPDIDGYEVCRRFKEFPFAKDVPVLFLTALEKADQAVKGLKVGAVDYIRKPFDKEELYARVKVHLDLRKTRLDLKNQIADNQQLVHILCHDLTNPISGTSSLLELMKDDIEGLQKMIPAIKQGLDRGLELIDLVRQMAAIDEDKIDIQLEAVNLAEAINESQVMLDNRLKEKQISLNIEIDSSFMVMVEKASFINSVINNLLTNAIKFSHANSRIGITAKENGEMINCIIRDYGIGMSEDLLSHVFSMNAKSSRNGTNNEKGTGFGMPLVKRFIESYGGTINISSWDESSKSNPQGTEILLKLNKPR